MDKDQKQICQIRIVFPTDSDQEAIDYKKKIADVMIDKSEAIINFSLSNVPPKPGI